MSKLGQGFGMLFCGMLVATSGIAVADEAIVTFTGSVETVCTLKVDPSGGRLTSNGTLTSLSSKNPGGQAAKVDVTTTGGVVVSIGAANTTAMPSKDPNATIWAPTYLVNGVQPVSETGLPTLMVGSGPREMLVHLTGTKASAQTSFVGGDYTATVTVRCE